MFKAITIKTTLHKKLSVKQECHRSKNVNILPVNLRLVIVIVDPISGNIKWYQSLVKSFDQKKNNIQAQQKKKMVKTSSSSKNEACCSKSCKKNIDSLNLKITKLTDKLSDSKNMLFHYKLALSQVEGRLVEFKNQEIKFFEKIRVLEFKEESKTDRIEYLTNELEILKKEKGDLDSKLTVFQTASKDLDNLLESQRSNKNKKGLGYSAVPPPPAQVYSPPKKDMSWTGLPEFADDTITDYSRPLPTIESNSDDLHNKNPSVTETGASSSTILSKLAINFVKAAERLTESKIDKVKTAKKPAVKYAELYRKTSKRQVNTVRPKVVINRRNWVNDVKASACWVWKPVKPNSASIILKRYNYVDEDSMRTKRSRGSKSKEVVDYILQVKIKFLIKKLEDSEYKHQV
nr:hypothetical protein [Tanacetum cinerariifolium]